MAEPDNNAPQQPGLPEGAPQPPVNVDLKSARTLSTVSTIAGPVSFIIGGMALSTVALVCGIIALVKTRRALAQAEPAQKAYAAALRQTSIVGIAIGAVALVVNAIGVLLMMPVLMEVLQTGDYSSILGDAGLEGLSGGSGSGGSGAWG